jgi:hypothetical protein
VPSTNTQANVAHRVAVPGSVTSNSSAATASSRAVCTKELTSTCPVLPTKYDAAGIGVPRSRLSRPSSRSTAIVMAMLWKLDSMMPVATMPGRKYWANGVPGATSAPSCPNTVAKIASMITG